LIDGVQVYRGKLIEAEDNMNCQMSDITVTHRDGRVAQVSWGSNPGRAAQKLTRSPVDHRLLSSSLVGTRFSSCS